MTRDAAHDHELSHGHNHSRSQGLDTPPSSAARRLFNGLLEVVRPHSHEAADRIDSALESSREGLRTLWISLVILGVTALSQVVVVVWSGSVALLGDTAHNAADALTAVPLGIAFLVGRRPPTRRYTYGYGRLEDLAGAAVVVFIAASAVFTGYEAVRRLAHPQPVQHLWAVAAAGVLGFVGNELVARYRIRTGRRIGSAALVADGLHARTDGFTSLAVVAGAGGIAAGWTLADPIVGLLITVAIVVVLRDAAREVYRRLMDAVDPALLDRAESTLVQVTGIVEVTGLRLRWVGHRLHADAELALSPELTLTQADEVLGTAEQRLAAEVPQVTRAVLRPHPAAGTASADASAVLPVR